MNVLWYVPDKPANISVGRQRIATGLERRGYDVTLRQATAGNLPTPPVNADVVMGTTRAGGLFGLVHSLMPAAVPVVIDHVDPIRQFHETAGGKLATVVDYGERAAFRRADGVVYVYDEECERVESRAAVARQTTLGVDYDRFANPATADGGQRPTALDGVDSGFAVYIGGLEPIYNVSLMVQAARESGVPLVVAGDGSRSHIVHNAATACDHIHYLGTVDHGRVPALLQHAGAGVSLADDPHTVKVLEYAAAGLPVVQLAGRAGVELPNDGVHWAQENVESVADALTAAVSEGESDALREYARGRTWKAVVDDYDDVLQEVMA